MQRGDQKVKMVEERTYKCKIHSREKISTQIQYRQAWYENFIQMYTCFKTNVCFNDIVYIYRNQMNEITYKYYT